MWHRSCIYRQESKKVPCSSVDFSISLFLPAENYLQLFKSLLFILNSIISDLLRPVFVLCVHYRVVFSSLVTLKPAGVWMTAAGVIIGLILLTSVEENVNMTGPVTHRVLPIYPLSWHRNAVCYSTKLPRGCLQHINKCCGFLQCWCRCLKGCNAAF